MHYKRKKPKNSRAGCLMCKEWKVNGFRTESEGGESWSDHVRREADAMELSGLETKRKAKSKKRKYTIECKSIKKSRFWAKEWTVFKRYKIKESRDEALKTLKSKELRRFNPYLQYRKGKV
jgi:hypothetical protein